jgi:2-dehydropantoate 2-reductase
VFHLFLGIYIRSWFLGHIFQRHHSYCHINLQKRSYKNNRNNNNQSNGQPDPDEDNFKADLIIISTKSDGLNDAVKNIKNFVTDETIIMSLLNGVKSEEIISETYGWKHLLLSYFIGHSSMRDGNKIVFDGVGNIVFGVKDSLKTDINDIETVKRFFDKVGISYKTPDNMYRAYWLKYMMNVSTNQPSAILKMTFGQMQKNEKWFLTRAWKNTIM